MKKRTVIISLALLLVFALLAGCGSANGNPQSTTGGSASTGSSGETTAAIPDPMDLTLYLWGDKPNQMDDILAEFSNKTKDTLNMKLAIDWTPQADFPNKMKLKLSAGEPVDFCFDAPWMNMNTFIAQGNYRDLTSYFNNPAYPGLQKSFDSGFLSNNLFNDKVMGVPLSQTYGGSSIVYLRGDLREKYGLAPITTLEGYEAYLQKVKQNEANMIPFVMKKDGTYGASGLIELDNPDLAMNKYKAGLWDTVIAPGITATLYVQDYQIKDCIISGEPESSSANLPAPYNKRNTETAKQVRAWYEKGYIEKDVITRDDAMGTFTSGKGASFFWDTAQYAAVQSALAQSVPGAKLEVYVLDRNIREDRKAAIAGSYRAWNFISVPITTSDAKTDRIMKFMDWLFASPKNHDLFEWGVEGKNYIAVGEDQYKRPEGLDLATNYNFPGYMLTWNPYFIRLPADIPSDVVDVMKYGNNPESYFNPLLSGFNLNGEPVKNQLANPDFLTAKTKKEMITLLGVEKNIDSALDKLDKEITSNKILQEDIKAIKDEVIKQCQAYLDQRKLTDQKNGTVYPK